MNKINFLPILLGSDENAYGCARIFYDNYKIKPLLLCAKPLPPTSYSKILTRKIIKDFDREIIFEAIMDELLPALKEEPDKLIVIPCSDYYAELVIKNRELISKYSVLPIISRFLYQKICDKTEFYNLCKEKNLPIPQTVILTAYELLNTPLPFGYPAVIKPQNSNSFSYLHLNMDKKKKVYFCDSEKEIKETAKALVKAGYSEPLIVQRLIPGDKSLTVNAYCDTNGRVRFIGCAKPILEYKSPLLIGNYAALKTVKETEVCEKIIAFLENLGYVGFVNFDLKFDDSQNKYLFLELNPRQGRSSYYTNVSGTSLIKSACDDVIFNTPYSGVTHTETDAVWRNVPSFLLKALSTEKLSLTTRTYSAISYFYDFSPMRAYTLLKRDISSVRLLRE